MLLSAILGFDDTDDTSRIHECERWIRDHECESWGNVPCGICSEECDICSRVTIMEGEGE